MCVCVCVGGGGVYVYVCVHVYVCKVRVNMFQWMEYKRKESGQEASKMWLHESKTGSL